VDGRTLAYLGRILIVDDEPKIRSFIGRALAAAGYATEFADSGAEGLRRALATRYDLVILDLVMPDLDGRQVLGRLLAARPGQAVIVLSCVADVAAKVDCLERGAQDYLTKPFSLAELLARVRVRLRGEPHAHAEAAARGTARTAAENGTAEPGVNGGPQAPHLSAPSAQGSAGGDAHPHAEVIRAGDVSLDVGRLVADIGHGPVPLTRLEFLLLRELAEHVGQSVPKGKLLATVWGYDFDPGSNVVDVCVRRLRSKLGFDLIKTVRGEGYQLVAR
jgi:two-component system, OmpR family, response regulator